MRMTEFLDRTGILLTQNEYSLVKCHKDDDRPLSDWLCLFDSLGLLPAGISQPS